MLNIFEKILVVDYGSSDIKGLLFGGSGKNFRLIRSEISPVIEVNLDGGPSEQPLSPDGLYEYNVLRFVNTYFPQEKNVIINLPLDRLYVRDINIPVTDIQQIQEVIPHEVENILPVSLENAEVIGRAWEIGEEFSRVMTFTASHRLLENRVLPLTRESVSIRMITPDSVGLASAINLLDPSEYENSILGQIDIGGSQTIINLVREGELIFTRKINLGGEKIREYLRQNLKLDTTRSSALLKELNISTALTARQEQAVSKKYKITTAALKRFRRFAVEHFRQLALEIERSFLSLQYNIPEQFYISGGGSLMNGLCELFENNLDVRVARYPFELSNNQDISCWITALGTIEHYRQNSEHKVDFLMSPFGNTIRTTELNLRRYLTPVGFLVASIFITIASFLIDLWSDNRDIRAYADRIVAVSSKIPGLEDKTDVSEIMRIAQKLCKNKVKSMRGSSADYTSLELLNTLTEAVPGPEEMKFMVRKFVYERDSVEFEATVDSYENISTIQKNLAAKSVFKEVQVLKQQRLPDESVRFTMKMELRESRSALEGDCN